MATLYYNAAVNTDWSTLGNWWTNEACSAPASSLPSSVDTVIILANNIDSNSGSNPTVYYISFQNVFNTISNLTITSVTGCEFNDEIMISNSNITGDCTFYWSNYIYPDSHIIGDCTFNYYSANGGTITGDCAFNNGGSNGGTITGDCSFYQDSYNTGDITGNCTFNDTSKNIDTITGNCTFNNASYNEDPGTITGNVTFNDLSGNGQYWTSSIDGGNIYGDVVVNNSGVCVNCAGLNRGIFGNITFNDTSYGWFFDVNDGNLIANDTAFIEASFVYDTSGDLDHTMTFNDYSILDAAGYVPVIMNDNSIMTYYGGEITNTFNDNSHTYYASLGAGFGSTWIFNDYSYIDATSSFYGGPVYSLTFNHNSYNDGSIEANTVTFNDSSYNNGPITCTTSTFKDSSYNSASGVITGDEVYNDRTPYPIPRGINGSSILGII